MDPRAAVLYEVFPQLDALGVDGVARLLGAFSTIETEADEIADKTFGAYGQLPGEGDMGDFADSARDEGIAYYQTLSELKQGVTNLLAVGLYHLFEQHRDRVKSLLAATGRDLPDLKQLSNWPKIEELRLVANTVKHADGKSAAQLRSVRPDYFVDPILRDSPLGQLVERSPRRIENPLGGTDLFVGKADLDDYRDALRGLWEELLPNL
jgi:hypothetical protein